MKKIFTVKHKVYDCFGLFAGYNTHESHQQTACEAIQEASSTIAGQYERELIACTWRYVHNNEE